MLALLAPILSNWRLILGGRAALAVVGFGLYFNNLCNRYDAARATIVEQRGQLDQMQEANASLDRTIAALKADHDRQLAALTADRDRAAARAARTAATIQGIRNAPATDDAPVAPVLSRTLDGLRKPGTAPGGAKPGGTAVGP